MLDDSGPPAPACWALLCPCGAIVTGGPADAWGALNTHQAQMCQCDGFVAYESGDDAADVRHRLEGHKAQAD